MGQTATVRKSLARRIISRNSRLKRLTIICSKRYLRKIYSIEHTS